MRILLVEDELEVAEQIKMGLENHFVVDVVNTGSDGVYYAQTNKYDVVLVDIGLPDISGSEVCKLIKNTNLKCGVIVVSARYELGYKVSCLDLGADDYVTKPFSFSELLARIRSVLRRLRNVGAPSLIKFSGVEFDLENKSMVRDGVSLYLTKKEFKILEHLCLNKSKVVSRDELLNNIWENDCDLNSNTVDVHLRNLRKKLTKYGLKNLIKTVYGFGYKFSEE